MFSLHETEIAGRQIHTEERQFLQQGAEHEGRSQKSLEGPMELIVCVVICYDKVG